MSKSIGYCRTPPFAIFLSGLRYGLFVFVVVLSLFWLLLLDDSLPPSKVTPSPVTIRCASSKEYPPSSAIACISAVDVFSISNKDVPHSFTAVPLLVSLCNTDYYQYILSNHSVYLVVLLYWSLLLNYDSTYYFLNIAFTTKLLTLSMKFIEPYSSIRVGLSFIKKSVEPFFIFLRGSVYIKVPVLLS